MSLLPKLLKNRYFKQLIITEKGKYALFNILSDISDTLKKQYKNFKGLYQLRASVIHNWVKGYGLRKVQYLMWTQIYIINRKIYHKRHYKIVKRSNEVLSSLNN